MQYKDIKLYYKNKKSVMVKANSFCFIIMLVSGCQNIDPPNGAWMTRDGDVMEIGCHSGAKSWSLKCEHNQWTGAVGQCGAHVGV